jgi:hypothetical protein
VKRRCIDQGVDLLDRERGDGCWRRGTLEQAERDRQRGLVARADGDDAGDELLEGAASPKSRVL